MIIKVVHGINFGFVAITIIWYMAAGYQALTAQFLLGCYQIITAIILTALFRKFEKRQLFRILAYWLLVLTWVILVISLEGLKLKSFIPVILIWLPMCIAVYFVYVTYVFSLKLNNHEP